MSRRQTSRGGRSVDLRERLWELAPGQMFALGTSRLAILGFR
jgi:hypothetical protein